MPRILFDFEGFITANITEAYCLATGTDENVSAWTQEKLIAELHSGRYAISLQHAIESDYPADATIELSGYQLPIDS